MSSLKSDRKVICVLCHTVNEVNVHTIDRLYRQAEEFNIDVVVLTDNPKTENKNWNIKHFDYDELRSKYNSMTEYKRKHIGNTVYPFLDFAETADYDWFMFYEDDLTYTGNIGELYERLTTRYSDYDCCFPSMFIQYYDKWVWLDEICEDVKHPDGICKFDTFHVLMNLYVMSKDAANRINNILRFNSDWRGHHEWVIPTVLMHYKFNIKFFCNDLNRCILRWNAVETEDHMLHEGVRINSLYHPIKTIWAHDCIMKSVGQQF